MKYLININFLKTLNLNLEEIFKQYPVYEGTVGGRFKDLSGTKIGELLILYRTLPCDAKERPAYLCLCDCGNFVVRTGDNLKRNRNQSCGHCKNTILKKQKEYDNFIILNYYKDENDFLREHASIKCKTCGNILHPRVTDLYKSNNIKCPRCNKNNHKPGERIGKLTLLEFKIFDIEKGVQWKCKCDCGNIVYLSNSELNGRKSCGQCNNNPEDIVGLKFGKLTVVKNLNIFRGHQRIYLCQCDCGNTCEVSRGNLLTQHTISCGCVCSYNEEKIGKMLIEEQIPFIKNKPITVKDKKIKPDFYVNNHYIIEFDGEQHFSFKDSGWNTKENFNNTRKRDLIKNKYCFDNNIPLIRIPYDAEYTIDDLKLETTRFLLTPENEKEYYESRIKTNE